MHDVALTPIAAAVGAQFGITVMVPLEISSDTWIECFGPKWLQRQRWGVAAADASIEHVKKGRK